MSDSPKKRVRLTHIVVQAHFVVDHDGDKLERKHVDAVELEPDQVQAFFDERLPAVLRQFEAELNGGTDG